MGKQYQRDKLEGKKIKKYNLLFILGSGSYGTVYKAVDTKTNDILAIKVLSKKQIKEIPKLEQLVKSQIQILKQVNNENIIKFIDSFSSGDNIFIVTEFCNGGDLQEIYKKKGRIPQAEAINYLKQILNGFKGLHQINTMHRDFKLANVLLHNHVCKIADLGFAKQMNDKKLTITQLGTDETMAPQVIEHKQYGWQADIWSLGVVFYQMIYGRLPYKGFSDYDILRKIKTTRPQYDDIDVSQQTIDFLQKCLVYDPKDRIRWKDIYKHPLLYKSEITLTTGLLRCSRINFQGHKTYYDKNQQYKRKTIHFTQDQISNKWTKNDKDLFQNAGDIKNADTKAEIIEQNKELLEAQFSKYESMIIKERNNKMFGITHVLPLQKQFYSIQASHSEPLYEICKLAFMELKKLRQQVTRKNQSYRKLQLWKQFKMQDIYKSLCDQLFEDQMFAESLAVSYKVDLVGDDNMNRPTNRQKFKDTLLFYRRQLTPSLKKQSKKNKLKYIKMLKALKVMEDLDCDRWNFKSFSHEIENINLEREEKQLLRNV